MSDKKEKAVDLRERVEVYPTEKAKYHEAEYLAGEKILVSPTLAQHMLKKGWASETKPAAPSVKKTGKDEL